ncbi:putative MAPEG superfamily protein [Thioclava sp. ES.031]|uniref:MAPEG family protein n=1 Tax=Thioclava sp. ES.031 TaxID=1798203 RepID=UPI000BF7B29F|nr:MAPEG family protein [Thioclava sp. ES.031]PFG62439.1 putative MAPEG superfamily protein [Thioclava sp. ES.031]
MTPELTVLILAVLLHLGLMVGYSIKANTELGPRYPLSPRDKTPPQISTLLGRLQRAMNNSFEGLILFAPVALVVGLTGQTTALTTALAWIFLAARILYIPAYLQGWVPWRSYVWSVSFFAILALAIAALI